MSSPDEKLTSFESKGGQVEVFPQKPVATLPSGGETIDPKTLAARDSLALQEADDEGGSTSGEDTDVEGDEHPTGDEEEDVEDAAGTVGGGRNQRRNLRIGLLLALVLAVVLATVLTSDNRKQKRTVEPGIVAGAEEEAFVAPTAAPVDPLEATPEFQILQPYVDPPSKLLDPDTPQGKAFQQILSEDITEDREFRIKQRFAMMVVYFSMGGESWAWQSGWSDFSQDECDWHGVAICRFRDGRRIAAGLQIPSNNAVGGVPEEICMLDDMETILFENNQLGGELPSCMTSLSKVFEFDVHNNEFTGQPPSGFLDMPNLETLDLSSNSFSGSLEFLSGPESRSGTVQFSRLTTLRLNNNGFEGEIPDQVYELDSLEEMSLHDTAVTGDVSAMCDKPSVTVLTTDCSQVVCNEQCCNCV